MGLSRLVAAMVLLAAPTLAVAQDGASARAFVERLYRAYHGDGPDYLGHRAKAVFTPRLIALIRRDAALAHGEVGALDGDPICDCQDFEITSVRAEIRLAGPGRAVAVVRFRNFKDPQTVTLDLVDAGHGWRIDNIHSKSTPDLADYLRKHAGGR